MTEEKVQLIFGALLHDIGKVVYRGKSEQGTHSKLGADFLDQIREAADGSGARYSTSIVQQIRYHHATELKNAKLNPDSLAYITYFADNISAGMDRKNEGTDSGFDPTAKLRKIFNILNGHNDDNTWEHDDYNTIREAIKKSLPSIEVSERGIGSLLNLLEAYCEKIPSSTNKAQLIDVSLFDHAKTTAAIASCLYEYLTELGISDYKAALFDSGTSARYYDEDVFLLWSCDMSGIQSFIYTISGKDALKQLRARSLYLEMMLEHIADELLLKLGLSRCNLLFSGGGHIWALLPNTKQTLTILDTFMNQLKEWFLSHFKTDLFVAHAFVTCSGNDLANEGTDKGRYRRVISELSTQLSKAKGNRYSAEEIFSLNYADLPEYNHARECRECHRSESEVGDNEVCHTCSSLAKISAALVNKEIFVVSDSGDLELPLGHYLSVLSEAEYRKNTPEARRVYTKNEWHTGLDLATHIWMGDYKCIDELGGDFNSYAYQGKTLDTESGIERLGVLRADVDNLGAIFANGLPDEKISLSRTAALSRALSYFFKLRINQVLEAGCYRVQIIYSGGDDLFLVGNWSDVLHAARDLRRELDEFTGNGTLSISAGIGMFGSHYPIARMADQVGVLEDAAKHYTNDPKKNYATKNALALWDRKTVYSWTEFERSVVSKHDLIGKMFKDNEKGKSFIYRLIILLRNTEDAISIPRLAYLLARSFEDKGEKGAQESKQFYEWATDPSERKSLITALEWYVYSIRERG